ncbi:MAG: hypothetical protein GY830_10200 [Bacteroidetes bacterium]|nr:hypothetical protein [Bacteroidota bacterium]
MKNCLKIASQFLSLTQLTQDSSKMSNTVVAIAKNRSYNKSCVRQVINSQIEAQY